VKERNMDDIQQDIVNMIDKIIININLIEDAVGDICKSKREKPGIQRERIPGGED